LQRPCYVPDPAAEEADARESLNGFVFWQLFPTRLIEDNRPVRDHDATTYPRYVAAKTMVQKAALAAELVVAPALRQMLADARPAIDEVVSAFVGAGLIPESERSLLALGLNLWKDGRTVEAIHVLIPRVEDAVRRRLAAVGVTVVVPRPTGAGGGANAYHVETFDALLSAGERHFPAGYVRILRLLMTSPEGPHLRNRVCHGIARVRELGPVQADCVVYCLLLVLRLTFEPPPAGADPENGSGETVPAAASQAVANDEPTRNHRSPGG